jgi:sugar phosphate isomerase/epimerase
MMLDDTGLTSPSAHIALEPMLESGDSLIEAAGIIGHEYIVIPWLNESYRSSIDSYRSVCSQLNELGQKCKASGVKLAYHNHAFEFETVDGQVPFDVMLDECDPDLVNMELDLFWITEGGQDPLAYFAKYPGRFPLCHVKDRMNDGTMVSVGSGAIDFAKTFAMSDTAGLKYFIVEHDNPEDALASVKSSYDYLSSLEF